MPAVQSFLKQLMPSNTVSRTKSGLGRVLNNIHKVVYYLEHELQVQGVVHVHAVVSECDYLPMNNIIPTHKAEPLDTKFI